MATALLVAVAGGAGAYAFAQPHNDPITIPRKIVQQVRDFTPYYLNNDIPGDFTLVEGSTTYSKDVLTFSLSRTDGKKAIVTETKALDSYNTATLQATEDFVTSYGRAYVIDGTSRTVGILLTKDKTTIVINAPSPIDAKGMHNLIDSLKPINH